MTFTKNLICKAVEQDLLFEFKISKGFSLADQVNDVDHFRKLNLHGETIETMLVLLSLSLCKLRKCGEKKAEKSCFFECFAEAPVHILRHSIYSLSTVEVYVFKRTKGALENFLRVLLPSDDNSCIPRSCPVFIHIEAGPVECVYTIPLNFNHFNGRKWYKSLKSVITKKKACKSA